MVRAVDRETKARIDSLLYELRTWVPGGEPKETLAELAKRFDLDPFVVKRIAHAEGWPLEDFTPLPGTVQEEMQISDTQPITLDGDDEPENAS